MYYPSNHVGILFFEGKSSNGAFRRKALISNTMQINSNYLSISHSQIWKMHCFIMEIIISQFL